LGHQLSRPGDTRWNSLYDSLKQILKNKEKNCELFEALGLKNSMLKDSEYIYIEEHLKCVGPSTELYTQSNEESHDFFNFDPLVSTGSNAQQSRRSATSEAEIQVH